MGRASEEEVQRMGWLVRFPGSGGEEGKEMETSRAQGRD